jgi:cell division protein FtsW (lipid II flippase)
MNMGLLPITGVPYPLVSAGGSSLLATMTSLGIVMGTKKL